MPSSSFLSNRISLFEGVVKFYYLYSKGVLVQRGSYSREGVAYLRSGLFKKYGKIMDIDGDHVFHSAMHDVWFW